MASAVVMKNEFPEECKFIKICTCNSGAICICNSYSYIEFKLKDYFMEFIYYTIDNSVCIILNHKCILYGMKVGITLKYNLTKLIQSQSDYIELCSTWIDYTSYTFTPSYIISYPEKSTDYIQHLRIFNEIFNLDMEINDDILVCHWVPYSNPCDEPNQLPIRISNTTRFVTKLYSKFELYFKNMFPITFKIFMNSWLFNEKIRGKTLFIQNIIDEVQRIPGFSTFIFDFFEQDHDYEHKLQFVDIPIDVV